MIDYFALALCHALLLIALLRLARRDDVDSDAALSDEPEPVAEPELSRRERRALRRKGSARSGDRNAPQNGRRNGRQNGNRADA